MTLSYTELSEAQIAAFVEAPRFGVLATNRRDGPPQLTPVWYLCENKKIYVSVLITSAKYKNLCRDPRGSLCIAGQHPDARAVIFSGPVELVPGAGDPWVDDIVWRLTRRYYENDESAMRYLEAEKYAGENALVVLTPERVIAQDYN